MRASAIAIALAACGGPPSGAPDAAPDVAIGAPDAAPCAPGAIGFPAQLAIGPAQGSIDVPFTANLTGNGASAIGAVSIDSDVGTIGLDGASLASFVYMTVPFDPYTLYQGFAVGGSRWDVYWLYCMNGALVDIYDEGIDGPALFVETATGACSGAQTTTTAQVALPTATIAAPTPVAIPYSVHGDAIRVEANGTGSLTLGGTALPLVVFGTVDCESGCGSPGWYELHSVVWDAAHARAIFVIVYLERSSTSSVELTYARALPDLSDPIGTLVLPAAWSLDPGGCPSRSQQPRATGGPRFGVPPPRYRR
jgi:hypothetical protein